MLYKRRLPRHEDIVWLSKTITRYPVDRVQVARVARMWSCPDELLALIRQLPINMVFTGRAELTERLESARRRIRSEWETPTKNLT